MVPALLLGILVGVAGGTRLLAALVVRHDEQQERLRRWSGGRWVTIGDEAEDWLDRQR